MVGGVSPSEGASCARSAPYALGSAASKAPLSRPTTARLDGRVGGSRGVVRTVVGGASCSSGTR